MKHTPSSTIITFDLHDVVLTMNYREACGLMWRNKRAMCVLALHACNPVLLARLVRLWRSNTVIAGYLLMLEQNYPRLIPHLPFMVRVANAQQPIPTTINLIRNLKARGYTVHLLSNIGDHLLEELRMRFAEVIDLFDAHHVTQREYDYLGKPHAQMFTTYQARYNPENKQVIFIDDKQRNIAAAQQYGMIALRFYNPVQLQHDLEQLLAGHTSS